MSIDKVTIPDSLKSEINNKLDASNVVNNLTTNSSGYALDARQGKVLSDSMMLKNVKPLPSNFDNLTDPGYYYYSPSSSTSLPKKEYDNENSGIIEIIGPESGAYFQKIQSSSAPYSMFIRRVFAAKTPSDWMDISPFYDWGDSIDLSGYACGGFITNSAKDVYFSFPLAKPVYINTGILGTTVSISGLTATIRNNGTYIHGSANGHASVSSANLTVTIKPTFLLFKITVTVTGSTNNNSVGIHLGAGTATFDIK